MQDLDPEFTLLLVDDNPTNLLLVAQIIEFDLPQVRVLTARSAGEGLAIAAAQQIDGAFIDVQMPQMDGLQMCRQLRLNPRTAQIPLVLMTAHVASPQMRADGLDVGAYDFISQPISNVEMLARIKVMLRLCKNERHATGASTRLRERLEEHSTRLRWLSGLLISGEGSLAQADQQWVRQLAAELPLPRDADDRAFFDKLVTDFPLPWRRTLLKLSLLDGIPLPLARSLSEIPDITAGLEYLQRHQLSLVQGGPRDEYLIFQPQTRDLLRHKAEQLLTEQERLQVYRTAADWYREQGQLLPVLACLVSADQHAEVSQLLSQTGLALLNLNRPDSTSLQLLDQVADDVAAGCGWQSLFRGINRLERLATDAEVWLELAYQHFSNSSDKRGMVLTQAWQLLQSVYVDGSRDLWRSRFAVFCADAAEEIPVLEPIERLEVLHALGLAELSFGDQPARVQELLTAALAEAQPAEFGRQFAKLNLLRARFALLQGRFLVATTAYEQALNALPQEVGALDQVMVHQLALELLHAAGTLSGLRKQQQFLGRDCPVELQRRALIEVVFSYYSASLLLARDQVQLAEQFIEMALVTGKAVKSVHLQSCLIQLRGWARGVTGNKSAALADLKTGLALRQQVPGVLCRLENLLLAGATCVALEQLEQAQSYLLESLEGSRRFQEERLRIGIHAWLALTCHRLGQIQDRDTHLRGFFELLRRHRVMFFWGVTADLLRQLLPLLSSAVERALLAPLVEKYLVAALDANNQLFELVRIESLGGFVFHKGDASFDLHQVGQASRLILAHLMMAQQRTMSTEVLMGQIWPDSPPAKARNNFDAAHSRLRRALEDVFGRVIRQGYLVLERGMVSLQYVKIDAHRFSEGMEKARYHLQREHYWQAEQILWRMDQYWNGEFLHGYDLGEEFPRYREHLNRLRLEQLDLLARLLRRRRHDSEACTLLQAGLSLDPTQDTMVRQLLDIYQEGRDTRAAEQLLKDYRAALAREEYDAEEIEELIDALGAQWLGLANKKTKERQRQ